MNCPHCNKAVKESAFGVVIYNHPVPMVGKDPYPPKYEGHDYCSIACAVKKLADLVMFDIL